MACYYCHKQGFKNNPDYGDCVVCTKPVCTAPPVRRDKKFHAAESQCKQHALVCLHHALEHAREMQRAVTDCFPGLVLAGSTEAIGAVAAEMAEKRTASRLSPESVTTLNDFLNFVTPGYRDLAAAVERSPDPGIRDLVTLMRDAETKIDRVVFAPEFYVEGALERVAALAVDVMGRAWRSTQKVGPVELSWLQKQVLRVLPGMRETLDAPLVERLLAALSPKGKVVSKSLTRALTYSAVPAEASVIADWVVSESVSMPAPVA